MAIIERDLGSVKGPKGDKGDQGDSYVLTNTDKEEIAVKVADLSLQRNVPITITVIHDYSELPIWCTIKLKNYAGNVIDESPYQQGAYTFYAPPFFDYTIVIEADGYQTISPISISGLTKEGFSQTVRAVPSTETTFTVDYKVDGTVVEHYVVQPHGSCHYQGEDISASGKLWVGWDDPTGNGNFTDITENIVCNATFCVPSEPSEIKDMSLYDFAYSDFANDNKAYSREEFAYIMLNDLAKTYFGLGNKISINVTGWGVTNDTNIEMRLEAFNHHRLAGEGETDFALTSWLAVGVLLTSKRMNPTNTNIGGFAASEFNQQSKTFYFDKLPAFWRSLIKKVKIKTSNLVESDGRLVTTFVESENYLWLARQTEVFADMTEPYVSEIDEDAESKTFASLISSATRIKKTYNGTGVASYWWLASPSAGGASEFRICGNNGGSGSGSASGAFSIALGFSI